MGKFKKALAGMMAVCMLMSTLTPAHPLASPRGEGFAPAAINSPPSFAFFRSNLPFSALKSSKLFTISHF